MKARIYPIRCWAERTLFLVPIPKNLSDPVILLRDRIRRVINTFIDPVLSNDSIGGQYLKNSIRRGVFMKYSPSQEIG
jgi:hypothetical protein